MAAIALMAMNGAPLCVAAAPDSQHWSFDRLQKNTHEPVLKKLTTRDVVLRIPGGGKLEENPEDSVLGLVDSVEGVKGQALKFDGFTTKVVRKAELLPPMEGSFTLEAWVAPQEYSQNHTGILDCSEENKAGYFLGIDDEGHVLFQANIAGKWEMCRSPRPLPLLCWSHVVATFDPATGMSLYLDGKQVASKPARGNLLPAAGTDLWIGMSHSKQTPGGRENAADKTYMVFDGLIDEAKLVTRAMSPAEVEHAYAVAQPATKQPLKHRVLPSGPQDGKRFGAFYSRLEYSPEWDAQWRVGDSPDVVVTFNDPGANFVFWRGTSLIPHWVTKNGIWYNNQFVERMGGSDGCVGCIEPMSDKRCRFSHVRILHSSPARTVIHWRYALVDVNYKQSFIDPYTSQGDWVDEYYYIYPDMVGIREMTLHSSTIDYFADWQESIVVHQPGRKPEDNIEATAVSIGNLEGEVVDYTYPEVATGGKFQGLPKLPCIQVVNLKSELRPFIVVPPSPHMAIGMFKGHSKNSIFKWWNHWPVSQGKSPSKDTIEPSRPSHSTVSFWKDWEPHQATETSETYLMMHGMSDKTPKELTTLAKAWLHPAPATTTSKGMKNRGFDKAQKAYVFDLGAAPDASAPLVVRLEASPNAVVVNPVLIFKNWPTGKTPRIEVQGATPSEPKWGIEQGLGGDDLVLWCRLQSSQPVEIHVGISE